MRSRLFDCLDGPDPNLHPSQRRGKRRRYSFGTIEGSRPIWIHLCAGVLFYLNRRGDAHGDIGVASSSAGFDVGDSVRVRYDPANPQTARIHSFFQTWGGPVLSGLVGVSFCFLRLQSLGISSFCKIVEASRLANGAAAPVFPTDSGSFPQPFRVASFMCRCYSQEVAKRR